MSKLFSKQNRIYTILTLLAAFAGIIWMFTNVGIDVTYQVSMAYRILKGDTMFLEMWEPHQTSAFLNVIFMWVYIKLLGTTTGIVLYLQIIGIAIRGAIAVFVYKSLKNEIKRPIAYGIALLFFMVSPKDFSLPEFGNMQLWFYTLLFLFLLKFFKTNKMPYLLPAAISLCLLVLSYPSCIIVYVPSIILIAIYTPKNKRTRSIILFTAVCALIGLAYAIFILTPMGFDTFVECVEGMLSLEPSHTGSVLDKTLGYLKNVGEVVLCFAVVSVVSIIPTLFAKGKEQKTAIFLTSTTAIFLVGFLLNILSVENRCAYGVIFLYIILLGLILSGRITGEEKRIYVTGTAISLTSFLATLILTDLELLVSVSYGIIAVGMALIPIYKWLESFEKQSIIKNMKICSIIFIVLLTFRAAYIRTPIVGYGQIMSSLDDLSLVRSGPAMGIITSEESSYRERDGYRDFQENLEPGTKVMIIDGLVNSLAYMYADSEVCAPSVMSDPTFSDNILKYYEINPDKMPDVLAIASYNGEIDYQINGEWLSNFIEEFRATKVVSGTFWTFYYR